MNTPTPPHPEGKDKSPVFEHSVFQASAFSRLDDPGDSTLGDVSQTSGEENVSGRMGQAFVTAGKLTQDEVARIIQLQRRARIRFGEAAIKLGLLTEEDVHAVLAQQFNYQTVVKHGSGNKKKISARLLIAHRPYSADAEAIRRLRSEILLRMGEQRCIVLGLVSPGAREGKSHIAASLAIAFSQLNMQTLLIDANLRKPAQHLLFDVPNKTGLSTMLAGRTMPNLDLTHSVTPSLRVLTSGPKPPNPSEILSAPSLYDLIERFAQETQVLLVDTPASSVASDAQIIAQQVGRVIILGREDSSRMSGLKRTWQDMETANVQVLGSFYNKVPDGVEHTAGFFRKLLARIPTPLSLRSP
jgi:chain length determinant protein tyrosine kinase EpsG